MRPPHTHASNTAGAAITRLKLKDQLADPYKVLALLQTILLYFAVMGLVLFVAHLVDLTDTFKIALL